MPLKDPPAHLAELLENLQETRTLLNIHEKVAGTGPGRKYGVEVLNKSALVLVVACWEAYIEDTVSAALAFLIDNGKDHTVIPKSVLERVASSKQGIKAWDLAGDGWKNALRDNLKSVLAKTTGSLNTPRASQIDELFHKVIGLESISSTWKWNNVPSKSVIARLDTLITTRGEIAHRVKHSSKVYKSRVRDALDLVGRLSARVNNETRSHVRKLVGKYPWKGITYKDTP